MTVLTLHAEVSVGHNVVRSCFLHGTQMSRTETNARQEDGTKENPAENATAPWTEERRKTRRETKDCSLQPQNASVAYAVRRCRERRQTYGGAASSRRRLLRVATGGGKHKSLRDCAVPGRPPPRPRFLSAFPPETTTMTTASAHTYGYFCNISRPTTVIVTIIVNRYIIRDYSRVSKHEGSASTRRRNGSNRIIRLRTVGNDDNARVYTAVHHYLTLSRDTTVFTLFTTL